MGRAGATEPCLNLLRNHYVTCLAGTPHVVAQAGKVQAGAACFHFLIFQLLVRWSSPPSINFSRIRPSYQRDLPVKREITHLQLRGQQDQHLQWLFVCQTRLLPCTSTDQQLDSARIPHSHRNGTATTPPLPMVAGATTHARRALADLPCTSRVTLSPEGLLDCVM